MIDGIRFCRETEFKETPIGKIPTDWNVQELGDESIADIIAGQSPPSSTYNKENRGLPFLQGKMEFGEMFPSPTTYCLEPIKIAKKNDVLLSVRAPVGDVNIAPSECCIGRGLAAIRAKVDKLNHLFLFYYLKLKGKRFEALSTGSTFKAIRIHEIEKFSIPVPSVEEQRVVVGVLGVVDSAIGLVDRVIWNTERLKKGLMQELLTKGIGHTEYKDAPIGKIPNEWEVDTLPNLMNIIDYRGRTPPFSESGIPYIGSNNIRNEKVVFESRRYVSEETYDKYMTRGIPTPGDILFTTEAPLGEVALVPKNLKFCFAQRLVALQCKNNDFHSPFFMYMLRSKTVQRQLTDWATGTTVKGISAKNMKFIKVPYSKDKQEQQRIADVLSTVDQKLELERKEKARLERVKRGLMDLLLTGKVRVKVD